ncbi:DUF3833 domain-containing protein [Sphingomonas sp. A2-49]|uniref:DUF3833 domain-containing protein n=1 Tax=Sphingomonas sp. A2-49 TaxID=1391375 RepID=UPI0021D33502|nr:DUF3833 domain-containing protein [Sphingomonas sp. A2-49]MCU6454148.1 DUF3833 domain-containing protein [Sphingomonas sp. A2-49]
MNRRPACAALLALAALGGGAGCVPGGRTPPPLVPGAPAFDPVAFFAGRTHGTGALHIVFRRAQATDVRGVGTPAGDGGIVLDQDVVQGTAPPKHRRWRLRPNGPGRYAGTLTDAVGPVVATARGSGLRIAFAMKGGLKVEQRLSLQPGGRVALNVMTVRKLGVVVARLDERIERQE